MQEFEKPNPLRGDVLAMGNGVVHAYEHCQFRARMIGVLGIGLPSVGPSLSDGDGFFRYLVAML